MMYKVAKNRVKSALNTLLHGTQIHARDLSQYTVIPYVDKAIKHAPPAKQRTLTAFRNRIVESLTIAGQPFSDETVVKMSKACDRVLADIWFITMNEFGTEKWFKGAVNTIRLKQEVDIKSFNPNSDTAYYLKSARDSVSGDAQIVRSCYVRDLNVQGDLIEATVTMNFFQGCAYLNLYICSQSNNLTEPLEQYISLGIIKGKFGGVVQVGNGKDCIFNYIEEFSADASLEGTVQGVKEMFPLVDSGCMLGYSEEEIKVLPRTLVELQRAVEEKISDNAPEESIEVVFKAADILIHTACSTNNLIRNKMCKPEEAFKIVWEETSIPKVSGLGVKHEHCKNTNYHSATITVPCGNDSVSLSLQERDDTVLIAVGNDSDFSNGDGVIDVFLWPVLYSKERKQDVSMNTMKVGNVPLQQKNSSPIISPTDDYRVLTVEEFYNRRQSQKPVEVSKRDIVVEGYGVSDLFIAPTYPTDRYLEEFAKDSGINTSIVNAFDKIQSRTDLCSKQRTMDFIKEAFIVPTLFSYYITKKGSLSEDNKQSMYSVWENLYGVIDHECNDVPNTSIKVHTDMSVMDIPNSMESKLLQNCTISENENTVIIASFIRIVGNTVDCNSIIKVNGNDIAMSRCTGSSPITLKSI